MTLTRAVRTIGINNTVSFVQAIEFQIEVFNGVQIGYQEEKNESHPAAALEGRGECKSSEPLSNRGLELHLSSPCFRHHMFSSRQSADC